MNNNEMTNARPRGTSINKNKLEILLSECSFSYEFYKRKIVKGSHTMYQSKYKVTDKHQNVLEILDSKEDLIIVSMRGSNFPFAAALIFALAVKYGRPELVSLDTRNNDEMRNYEISVRRCDYADITIYYTMNLPLTSKVKDSIINQHRATGYNTQLIECAELEKIAGHYLENYFKQ
ncbi:MAG: hypothetical protein ACRD8Z_06565 [Nitrososphaeraceae archaeon]